MTDHPRCPARGCPVRWRSGDDRPCRDHSNLDGGDLAARMAELTAAPGDHGADQAPA